MSNTPKNFEQALELKVQQIVSSILFHINDGKTPAEAIAEQRAQSTLGPRVWDDIEARVNKSEARTHDLNGYILTFRPTACQPIKALSLFAVSLEDAHERGRNMLDENYPSGVWVMLAPMTVREYEALRDGRLSDLRATYHGE